ncbi:hypothetical protein VTK73DRAFT_7143 [Phialemonium thermophilum]|uniref:Uncharacterized protein n=1 Tax=Phialemonium thermophilum TaxID=223376 RepID=A0ABR3WGD9_9PEZI
MRRRRSQDQRADLLGLALLRRSAAHGPGCQGASSSVPGATDRGPTAGSLQDQLPIGSVSSGSGARGWVVAA